MRPALALSLLSALALIACDDLTSGTEPPDPTFAVTSNEFDKTLEGPVTDDCTGETAIALARLHIVTTSTTDGAGGYHAGFRFNITGKLTFGTETRYVFHQTNTAVVNGKVGEEGTINSTFTLNGQGSVPNEVFQFRLHYTITPTGAVPSDWEWDDLKCQ
jgi:hypothetical protein